MRNSKESNPITQKYNMPVTITYFVHGTTTDNERRLSTGWAPGELSELGKKQAKELGRLVANREFAVVFCSDLKRAVDSAELAFGDKYTIIQDKRLRECDYGDLTQTPDREDEEQYIEKPFPNGESYKDVEKRVANFVTFLKNNYEGKHVAIVAHQAPQLAFDVIAKRKTWKQAIAQDWRKTKAWQPGWNYEV